MEQFNPTMLGLLVSLVFLLLAVRFRILNTTTLVPSDPTDQMPGWLLVTFVWSVAIISASGMFAYQEFRAQASTLANAAPQVKHGWQFLVMTVALLVAAWAGVEAMRRQARVQAYALRLEAAEALRTSEERYRTLLDLAPVGIMVHAQDKILYINPTAAHALGATGPEALIGRSIVEFIHPDNLADVQARLGQLVHDPIKPTPVEETYVRLDETPVHVQVMASVLVYEGQPAIQAVM